jgi:hypothetical protein
LVVGSDEAFNFGFMEVVFPTDMRRVGLWVTHGTVKLILKDSNNSNLATGGFMVTGNAGEFIGIERSSADVRGVTMGFPESFTIDDFTYSPAAIPEPTGILSSATSLALLIGYWQSKRRRNDARCAMGASRCITGG